jgi:hypothetical protein
MARRASVVGERFALRQLCLPLILEPAQRAARRQPCRPGTGYRPAYRPLDLDYRDFNGERFSFQCPPGRAIAGQVIGSGPYLVGSSICTAAVHAGATGSGQVSGGPIGKK